jgi:RHS repeat-associated protein
MTLPGDVTLQGGGPVAGYEYDEYGNLEENETQGFQNETTYTGSVTDKSTGLQYMNARYYDAENGRFLTQDTYTGNPYDPWTQHLYAYCGNNPVSMVDPTGHFPIVIAGLLWGLLEGILAAGTAYAGGMIVKEIIDHSSSRTHSPLGSKVIPRPSQPPVAKSSSKTQYSTADGRAIPIPGPAPIAKPKVTPKVASTDTAITDATVLESDRTRKGETVYRVFGGNSKLYGRSWTNVDPRTIPNYRNESGLPDWNTGEYLAKGILYDKIGVIERPALTMHGNKGGLLEYYIPKPIPVESKILVISRTKLDKPY